MSGFLDRFDRNQISDRLLAERTCRRTRCQKTSVSICSGNVKLTGATTPKHSGRPTANLAIPAQPRRANRDELA